MNLGITPKIIILILGVVLLLVYVNPNVEGFLGVVPTAVQSSMIPKVVAGATTNNPAASKPQARDILGLMDTMKNYRQLVDKYNPMTTNLTAAQKKYIASLSANMTTRTNLLQMALANSNASSLTNDQLRDWRADYDKQINLLRNATSPAKVADMKQVAMMTQQPKAAVAAGKPGVITLTELYELRKRIDAEKLRLANLRSRDPTIRNTISQLDKIGADVGDYISKVERNEMNIADVPINPESSAAFLRDLKAGKAPLPTLIVPKAKQQLSLQSLGTTINSPDSAKQLQGLLQLAQLLKWDLEIKIQYDPKVSQRGEMLNRLKDIESRLTSMAVSDKPIAPELAALYLKEMETLQNLLTPRTGYEKKPPAAHLEHELSASHTTPANSREPTMQYSSAEFPTSKQVLTAQGAGMGPKSDTFPHGETSNDIYIRPGYPVTNEMIARRASSSTFDEASVGGYDYKGRVQELCKQIKQAQLGEPDQFGCIENPTAVSSSYSWKGNHQMVCNRLGDTWGGWYPEMFGCPKYDPTQKFRGTMM